MNAIKLCLCLFSFVHTINMETFTDSYGTNVIIRMAMLEKEFDKFSRKVSSLSEELYQIRRNLESEINARKLLEQDLVTTTKERQELKKQLHRCRELTASCNASLQEMISLQDNYTGVQAKVSMMRKIANHKFRKIVLSSCNITQQEIVKEVDFLKTYLSMMEKKMTKIIDVTDNKQEQLAEAIVGIRNSVGTGNHTVITVLLSLLISLYMCGTEATRCLRLSNILVCLSVFFVEKTSIDDRKNTRCEDWYIYTLHSDICDNIFFKYVNKDRRYFPFTYQNV